MPALPARSSSTFALIIARIDRNSGSAARPSRLPVLALRVEIGVEHGVGVSRQAALAEIHEQEGEIVEHVDRGERIVELDRVEQDGRAVDLDDVAQVQIAVAVAHIASARPRLEQGRERGERFAARAGKRDAPPPADSRSRVGGKHHLIVGAAPRRAADTACSGVRHRSAEAWNAAIAAARRGIERRSRAVPRSAMRS